MEWLDRLDFSELIPSDYEDVRALVPEAIVTFVAALPARRVAEILEVQEALGGNASSSQRMTALARCCPTLHKLGQTLARDRRLVPGFRAALQSLESLPVNELRPDVALAIRCELEARGVSNQSRVPRVEPIPLAEASIAFVVPFTWHDPSRNGDVEGVFKILKPDVEIRLREDMAAWERVGEFLDDAASAGRIPPIDYHGTLEDLQTHLVHELDLTAEQAHLTEAMALLAGHNDVFVPGPLPLGTPRMTAMERVRGRLLGAAVQDVRPALADSLAQAFLAEPMFSAEESALFHADPHAGNLMLTPDGRVAILDWSLVGRLKRTHRQCLARLLLSGWMRSEQAAIAAIDELTEGRIAASATHLIRYALSNLSWSKPPGLRWMTDLLDHLALAGARLPSDLLLFRKVVLTLEGVWGDIQPGFDPDATLYGAGWLEFLREWPSRLGLDWSTPGIRTHLSTFDLAAAWMRAPHWAMDYWTAALGFPPLGSR